MALMFLSMYRFATVYFAREVLPALLCYDVDFPTVTQSDVGLHLQVHLKCKYLN